MVGWLESDRSEMILLRGRVRTVEFRFDSEGTPRDGCGAMRVVAVAGSGSPATMGSVLVFF